MTLAVAADTITMLKLNQEALALLIKFGSRSVLSRDAASEYRAIESSYNRLLGIFLYVNQEALNLLPRENIDDINSAISRIYESLFWARRSISSPSDDGYDSVEWLLISDKQDGMVTEAYKLVSYRLMKSCPSNLFLENSLIRLLNSYNIASDVTRISSGILSSRSNRSVDLKKKRIGRSFVLQANESGEKKLAKGMLDPSNTRIITGN